jgi:hypothetical protein
MIKYLLPLLLLIYLIGNICYTEYFENRTLDYSINVIPHKDSKESNKYIFYKNKKQIIESDLCEWNSKRCLKSIVKHNFNNNFDDIEIIKDMNEYTYKIILDGKKKHNYKIKRDDINKYIIYDSNDNKLYEVYRSIVDNKETITIRNKNFDKYAVINYDSNVYTNQYPNYKNNGLQFNYKTTNLNFNNQEILGYSIFKVIQEINREFYD